MQIIKKTHCILALGLAIGSAALSVAMANSVSLGTTAVTAANLVRERVVQDCIQDIEKSKGINATIADIRSSDADHYEITLFYRGGDVALGNVELAVASETVNQPWGPVRSYKCAVIQRVIHL